MNERIYILTGANGHLGRNILQRLLAQGAEVRALLLPGEQLPKFEEGTPQIVYGDVRDKHSLAPLFQGLKGRQTVVIHAAAIISITSQVTNAAQEVNVGGTANLIELCLAFGVWRYIHISSVHAIPEPRDKRLIREIRHFMPGRVKGGYAKTKAEATRLVLAAARRFGLNAIVLHPSGIIGPLDPGSNNLMAAFRRYLKGRLPACPTGGYDLVDVRDVADAALAAVDKGRIGEAYILSGRHYEMTDIFRMLHDITGRGGRCPSLPSWLVTAAAPFMEKWALARGNKPLVTRYSLHALHSNDNFSHQKASRELGFWPRDIRETLTASAAWIEQQEQADKATGTGSAKPPRLRRVRTAG